VAHVKDLKLPTAVEVVLPPERTIAACRPPSAAEEEEEARSPVPRPPLRAGAKATARQAEESKRDVMLVVGLWQPGRTLFRQSLTIVGFSRRRQVAERLSGELRALERGVHRRSRSGPSVSCTSARARRYEELVLLKPHTFMNRSGESVREAMSFFEIPVRARWSCTTSSICRFA
jgi:hypothetical protein